MNERKKKKEWLETKGTKKKKKVRSMKKSLNYPVLPPLRVLGPAWHNRLRIEEKEYDEEIKEFEEFEKNEEQEKKKLKSFRWGKFDLVKWMT